MPLRRIFALFLRQVYLMSHTPMRFINVFAWAILDIVVWGFLTKYLDSVQQLTFSFVPVLLGAVILWNFLVRVQQGVILSFLEDVWSRNFLNLFASPLKIREYVGGLILTSIVTSAVALAVMFVLALFVFGFSIFSLGVNLLVFLLILFIFGTTLGVFAAAMGLRFGPSAEWVAWLIPFVMVPFSGIYYPISALPGVLQPIGQILPTSYAFEGMRSVLLSRTLPLTDTLWGVGLALLYLGLAYYFFVRIYRYSLRTGLIARFSAENTSS